MSGRVLKPDKIVETIDRLARRIAERFPDSGLHRTCRDLADVAAQAQSRSAEIARPLTAVRLAVFTVIGAIVLVALLVVVRFIGRTLSDIEALEAATSIVVLIGAAVLFLMTLETRIKRRRSLRAIHEIRSIAHVIDMHQLTKDPERVRHGDRSTASSPTNDLTAFQLGRYLDYCSEMLSLVGKIAALYADRVEDDVVLSAANDVESLCTGLSRKIWQKIMIVQTMGD